MSASQESELVVVNNAETLLFGFTRKYSPRDVPDALVHLLVHYFGAMLIWAIPEPSGHDAIDKSKPFTVNGITFQCYFQHKVVQPPAINNIQPPATHSLDLWTKILSMPNSVRTCTVFYKYHILSRSFVSRHTFTLGATRARMPFSVDGGDGAIYPLQVELIVDPIRIHYWSYDNMVDYQQDLRMSESVQYEWTLSSEDRSDGYVQSPILGNCWCLDVDTSSPNENVWLKLLRLSPNVTRVVVECQMETVNWVWSGFEGELELGFMDGKGKASLLDREDTVPNPDYSIQHKNPRFPKRNGDYDASKDTVFSIGVQVIRVYAIDRMEMDDFETSDVLVPRSQWREMGIV